MAKFPIQPCRERGQQQSARKCFEALTKSDTMSAVTPWIKRAVWLLVIYGILHLLISPLPELGAAFSGKSVLGFFSFVTCGLLELFFLTLLTIRGLLRSGLYPPLNVLDMTCLQLC